MKRIWKQIICSFFILFTILFSGCNQRKHDTSPEYNAETDYPMAYGESGSSTHFVETEKGYYYTTSDGFLYFVDKSTMQAIAVCNRPQCVHSIEKFEECGAFLGLYAPDEIYYNNGKLYGFKHNQEYGVIGFEDVYFCEMAEDGTVTKKLWELQWDGGLPGDYQYGVFHRGVLYFYTTSPNSDFSIHAYDVESKKSKCIYMNEGGSGTHLKAVGNYLYWWMPKNDDILFSPTMRYEISTGKIDTIENIQKCFAGGDRVYFQGWDEEKQCALLSYSNRDGSGFTKTDIFLKARLHADDTYIYGCERETGTIYVYDVATMEEIATLDFSELFTQYKTDVLLPGYGDKLFLMDTRREHLYYAYKSAIGTDDFQWHQVEKVN